MRTACVWVFTGYAVGCATALAQSGPAKVTVATTEVRKLPASLMLVGTVQPATRSLIATEVAGIVRDMPTRQGDFVEKGKTICKLDDDAVRLRLAEAQAGLARLEAQLAELAAGTRKTELERLRALHESAKAEFNRWTFERERIRKLYGDAQSNQKEVYDTEAGYLSAESQMLAAKAQYDQGVEGPRKEELDRARFAVAEQRAVVQRLARDLAKTEIKAPFDGFVVRRHTEVGEWIDQGKPVVELVDLSYVLVRIDAPEQAIPFIQVDDRASVTIDALDNVLEGRIRHVIPQADEAARTFPVEVEVLNDRRLLKAGMFARVTVAAGPETEMVAVPKDAVSRQMGGTFVAVLGPGPDGKLTAFPTPVTIGLDIGDWVAVTSGNVAPATQVVVRGNEMINLMMVPSPVEIIGSAASAPGGQAPGP